MSCGSILSTDQIFRKLSDITLETKRRLLGKYVTGDKYETDFTQSIYHRDGVPICSNKFNFSPDGPKCLWCNTFSFLFDDGDIIPDTPIEIETGVYKGTKILIKRYPRLLEDSGNLYPKSLTSEKQEKTVFGKYKPLSVNYSSALIPVRNTTEKTFMVNQSCDISHKIGISSLINSSEFPFKSNILGAWLCEYIHTVETCPDRKLSNIVFNDRIMRNTFFQLFVLSGTSIISHGAPCSDCIMVSNERTSYSMGQKKIDMNTTILIEPSKYSSFAVDYNNRRLFFVGKDSPDSIQEPHWQIEYILTNENKLPTQIVASPAIPEFLSMRIPVIKPTFEMMQYIRLTGINIFPILYLFLYVTILMLNPSFYDLFVKSDLYDAYVKIFIEDDIKKYMNIVSQNVGRVLNPDEVLQILIDSEVRLRLDGIRILGGLIAPLY